MKVSQIASGLSPLPVQFPDCCLSLSTTLLGTLTQLLPERPKFTLSVGSGSGLLEALLSHHDASRSVEGVEVSSNVNRYIDEEDMHVAGGAWDLNARAQQASALMFVYPREPRLVSRYIETYGSEIGNLEQIVWLGPKADWADYEMCFRNSHYSEVLFLGDEDGLAPYETGVIARRHI